MANPDAHCVLAMAAITRSRRLRLKQQRPADSASRLPIREAVRRQTLDTFLVQLLVVLVIGRSSGLGLRGVMVRPKAS